MKWIASAAVRGCIVGTAVIGALWMLLILGNRNLGDGINLHDFYVFLWVLTLLPVITLVVGIAAAMLLRLPLGWLVGLIAPAATLGILQLLPSRVPVQVTGTIATYGASAAAAAALSSTIPSRSEASTPAGD